MARITSKQAKEMNEAYAKVHQNLQERESILSNIPSQSSQTRRRNLAGKEDLNTKTLGNNNNKSSTTAGRPVGIYSICTNIYGIFVSIYTSFINVCMFFLSLFS